MTESILRELVWLLSGRDAEEDELDRLVRQVRDLPDDPEFSYLSDPMVGEDSAIATGLRYGLSDYSVWSDKLDELHEALSELFEDGLPTIPDDLWEQTGAAYYDWLNGILASYAQDRCGYALALLDTGLDDKITGYIVLRPDIERITQLGTLSGLRLGAAGDPSIHGAW